MSIDLKVQWEARIGRRIKLRDLQILSAVVRWGSMAKAATHLAMSQPSVSEAMRTLEDALGVRLLDRSHRGIEATIYARALLKRADVVFDELKQGVRDIEFLANPTVGDVTIGCPESLAAGFVPAVVGCLSRQYPNVAVHVVSAQPGEQEFRELRERSVDLLLGRLFKPVTVEDVAVEHLCRDAFFVVAGAHTAWAKRRKIAPDGADERALDTLSGGQPVGRVYRGWIPGTGATVAAAPADIFFDAATISSPCHWAFHYGPA